MLINVIILLSQSVENIFNQLCETNFQNQILQNGTRRLIQYMKRVWIRQPLKINLFHQTNRTNNSAESYHRKLILIIQRKKTFGNSFKNLMIYLQTPWLMQQEKILDC